MLPPELLQPQAETVCDYCHRIQQPEGHWLAPIHCNFPAEHSIIWDICPDCCTRYVDFLLGSTEPDHSAGLPHACASS